jgi:hypothetical protein
MVTQGTREQILDLLAQVETLLEEATLDGQQLAEMECFEEVTGTLHNLTEQIEYYVD